MRRRVYVKVSLRRAEAIAVRDILTRWLENAGNLLGIRAPIATVEHALEKLERLRIR